MSCNCSITLHIAGFDTNGIQFTFSKLLLFLTLLIGAIIKTYSVCFCGSRTDIEEIGWKVGHNPAAFGYKYISLRIHSIMKIRTCKNLIEDRLNSVVLRR